MTAVPLRRNRDFVLLQVGQFLSNTGTQATAIAYPLLVLALTHSAVRAGVVSFARVIPMALFAIPAGLAADRWNRKALMVTADAVRVAALGSLVGILLAANPPFWAIILVAAVEGAGACLFGAAQPGALRAVVPTEQLPQASGAQSGRQAAVMLGGPPLGGALFEVARAAPFVVDLVSYVCSTLSLLGMRTAFQDDRVRRPTALRAQVGEGLTFLWSQPFVRTSAFFYGLVNFTGPGLLFCIVVIGKAQGVPSGAVGGLVAIFAASVAIGSMLARRVRRLLPVRAVLLLEVWCWVGCSLFLLWPSVYVLAVGLVPAGLAIPSTDSVVHGYRIAITPDHLLGRAESARLAISLLISSAAPLTAGLLLAHTTPRWTVGAFAGWAFALALWASTNESIRAAPRMDALQPAA